jgi:hypothetical protein
MGFRTNTDRILESIDRSRNRDDDARNFGQRQAVGRDLDTDAPTPDTTNPERLKRIFRAVERAYTRAAQSTELGPLAQRFQSVGDIQSQHARGDVSVSIAYLDSERPDDIGMSPFEIQPDDLIDVRRETKTSRPDVNAMKLLRHSLREGTLQAYKKIEPRVREGLRERADAGHIAVTVTLDLRPA